MSLRKDMTINERVFHQNINNRPSYVIHHLILFNIYYYLPTCGIQITCGHFREFTNVKEAFTASSKEAYLLQECNKHKIYKY